MSPHTKDRETYEILQIMPAPPGLWLKYQEDNEPAFFCRPVALALIECTFGRSKGRFVGPITELGEPAHEDGNFAEMIWFEGDPNVNLGVAP